GLSPYRLPSLRNHLREGIAAATRLSSWARCGRGRARVRRRPFPPLAPSLSWAWPERGRTRRGAWTLSTQSERTVLRGRPHAGDSASSARVAKTTKTATGARAPGGARTLKQDSLRHA